MGRVPPRVRAVCERNGIAHTTSATPSGEGGGACASSVHIHWSRVAPGRVAAHADGTGVPRARERQALKTSRTSATRALTTSRGRAGLVAWAAARRSSKAGGNAFKGRLWTSSPGRSRAQRNSGKGTQRHGAVGRGTCARWRTRRHAQGLDQKGSSIPKLFTTMSGARGLPAKSAVCLPFCTVCGVGAGVGRRRI